MYFVYTIYVCAHSRVFIYFSVVPLPIALSPLHVLTSVSKCVLEMICVRYDELMRFVKKKKNDFDPSLGHSNKMYCSERVQRSP